jgi:hypothetical protein
MRNARAILRLNFGEGLRVPAKTLEIIASLEPARRASSACDISFELSAVRKSINMFHKVSQKTQTWKKITQKCEI